MRTSETQTKGTCYSPDDGDYMGFLALVRVWVEEDAIPIPDRVVMEFAQKWSECGRHYDGSQKTKSLRSRKEWIKELRRHAKIR